MRNFWLSWYAPESLGAFEIHAPWWDTGTRMSDDAMTVVCAVRAESEEAAKEFVLASYDKRPETLEWRFCEERPEVWDPFQPRFPRRGWMQWNGQPSRVINSTHMQPGGQP